MLRITTNLVPIYRFFVTYNLECLVGKLSRIIGIVFTSVINVPYCGNHISYWAFIKNIIINHTGAFIKIKSFFINQTKLYFFKRWYELLFSHIPRYTDNNIKYLNPTDNINPSDWSLNLVLVKLVTILLVYHGIYR